MRIANAMNGLAYPPYDAVSMFLSTHGHSCKMGYFRQDAMPYMAVIELLKGGSLCLVDATQSDKPLTDAFKFGLATWCMVFNRAIGHKTESSLWVTRDMVRAANSCQHKKVVQRIRRLEAVFGHTRPAVIGENIILEVHKKILFDDKPNMIKKILAEGGEMSEFTCKNGHIMRAREYNCQTCGEPRYMMDGMTARQLMQEQYRECHPEECDG